MAIVKLTKENFKKEVLESDMPVMVDFFADWCAPCKLIAPTVEELAQKYEGKIKICKANVDEVPEIASEYAVLSIPTLIFFKKGKRIDEVTGAISKEELEEHIEKALK
jgi:thioredoxin 1